MTILDPIRQSLRGHQRDLARRSSCAIATLLFAACGGTQGATTSPGAPGSPPTTQGAGPSIPAPVEGWCKTSDAPLARAAREMSQRGFLRLPDNASLRALDLEPSLLYWSDSAVWDPALRQVRWVGGPGTCCSDEPTYQLLAYDVDSDRWTRTPTPFTGSGHAYDGNAIDPLTGTHYFALFLDTAVKRKVGAGEWSELPAAPIHSTPASALAYFPEAGGLVFVGGGPEAAFFDGATWSTIAAPDEPWGAYHVFAEPNPVQHTVWLGGGNGHERVSYVLDAYLDLERMPDAPVDMRMSDSLTSVDPATGDHLLFSPQTQSLFELDPIARAWRQVEVELPDFGGGHLFQVPIPDCQVIFLMQHDGERRTVYLYRHSPAVP
jgi:hypothetical protein